MAGTSRRSLLGAIASIPVAFGAIQLPASAVSANISTAWARWKSTMLAIHADPDGTDHLDAVLAASEDVIRTCAPATIGDVACQLWLVLAHSGVTWEDEERIAREDAPALLSEDSDFDFRQRDHLKAIVSLRRLAGEVR